MSDRPVKSYQDLRVWQDSMLLAEHCYQVTRGFPEGRVVRHDMAGIRRSAASIAANIAEGYGRENTGSFVQSLRIAQGSLKELETHLLLASCVGLAATMDGINPLIAECEAVGKMLRSLIRALQRKSSEK